jgi:hypothetical protein
MTFEFRPAVEADAELHARIRPDEPVPGETVAEAERYTVLEAGEPVGFARVVPQAAEEGLRASFVDADFLPEHRSHLKFGLAFDFVEERAIAGGAEHLVSQARESDDHLILFLRRRGYAGTQVFSRWELDLVRHRRELETAAGLAGARLLALTEAGPEVEAKLRELIRGSGEQARLERDRAWVAVRDGRLVAATLLTGDWIEWEGGELDRALHAAMMLAVAAARETKVRAEAEDRWEDLGWRRLPGMIRFLVSVEDRLERKRIGSV